MMQGRVLAARIRRSVGVLASAGLLAAPIAQAAGPEAFSAADTLQAAFAQQVDRRLLLPEDDASRYGRWVREALAAAHVDIDRNQFVVAVDRSPKVQAIFIFWLPADATAAPRLIGAAPVSTGRIGQFDHFETPLGVFDHSLANPDFRAEGTPNEYGVRGYGVKGMRVYDFGWQTALRGWGNGGMGEMRLQMHATDPRLEQWLGSVRSKGCIRIPGTLNRMLDHYGILDADYAAASAAGSELWVLRRDRSPTKDLGRYLVVIDSQARQRPPWAVQEVPS